jgi:hypothetical protein
MNVRVAVNLPAEVEDRLRAESGDLSAAVREGFVLDLFRRGFLTRHGLSQALGIDRFETHALLKRHQIFDESLTHDDVDSDVAAARKLLGTPRR